MVTIKLSAPMVETIFAVEKELREKKGPFYEPLEYKMHSVAVILTARIREAQSEGTNDQD